MFRQERNSNRLKIILLAAEIVAITTIAIALVNYLWENTQISSVDPSLQIAFLGVFALLMIFSTNYIINRRW